MRNDPFAIKETGADISDSSVEYQQQEIDGDIVISDSYRKRARQQWKGSKSIHLLTVIGVLLFVVLFGKLYYLQIVRGAQYYGTAEGNRIKSLSIIPPRGVIFDSRGNRLAYNVPDFALVVVPSDLPNNQEEEDVIFSTISKAVGIEQFDLVQAFSQIPRNSFSPIELVRGISQSQAVILSRDIDTWQGISLLPVEQRTYPIKEELSHILGYTGKISPDEYREFRSKGYELVEHTGKTGLEKTYQEALRGTQGEVLVEVDSNGKPTRELKTTDPVIGDNIYLHLDSELQNFIWKELESMVKERESPGGSVVVLNPQTGAVLALVSYPGYNNELFSRGIDSEVYQALIEDPRQPLFHRSITGEYPSGSTIKIVVGAAALEEGTISRYDTVASTGGVDVNSYWFPDWKYGGHGQTNIVHALADSVNTFFYAIGGGYQHIDGLGVARITEYGRKFGLDNTSGIDLPSESSGFLPSKDWKLDTKNERWYLGDTYHLAIGQGDVLVTPLQVANFTAIIANNGILYATRLVDRVGRDYNSAKEFEPEIINKQVVSREVVDVIQDGLRGAVTYGTARSLSGLSVDVAGKTGTAQFSSTKDPHAWFTGYAPYIRPEIVVTVLVEEGEGGDLSATPIAKKIFEWYFEDQI